MALRLDPAAVIAVVSHATASARARCSTCSRRGVLQPADRAAASDRVLRRPLPGVQLQHAGQEGARRAPSIDARLETLFARGIDPHESRGAQHDGTRRRPRVARPRDDVHAFADEADRARARRARRTPISSGPGIRCSIAPKRCSRSSSTRRCTRKRCSTCGIACRSTQKRRPPQATRRASERRARRGTNGSTFPAGRATLGRRPRVDSVRLGQRVSGARRRGRARSRSSGTT